MTPEGLICLMLLLPAARNVDPYVNATVSSESVLAIYKTPQQQLRDHADFMDRRGWRWGPKQREQAMTLSSSQEGA